MATEPEQEQQTTPAQRRSGRREEQAEQKAEVKVSDLPVSSLIEGAFGLLGVAPWTAAGALAEHDADEKMSIETAKAEVQKWLKTPIKAEGE